MKSYLLFGLFVSLSLIGYGQMDCEKYYSYLESGQFERYEDEVKEALIGSQFFDFELEDLAGNMVTKADFDDKTLVVNFWFYPCPPCIREIPSLNKLVEEFRTRDDIAFLAFSRTDKETLNRSFFNMTHFDYLNIPAASSYCAEYCFVGYPVNMIVDKKGVIRKIWFGGPMEDEMSVYRKIKPFILDIAGL